MEEEESERGEEWDPLVEKVISNPVITDVIFSFLVSRSSPPTPAIRDLANCRLVSRQWNSEFQTALWNGGTIRINSTNIEKFIEFLAQNPVIKTCKPSFHLGDLRGESSLLCVHRLLRVFGADPFESFETPITLSRISVHIFEAISSKLKRLKLIGGLRTQLPINVEPFVDLIRRTVGLKKLECSFETVLAEHHIETESRICPIRELLPPISQHCAQIEHLKLRMAGNIPPGLPMTQEQVRRRQPSPAPSELPNLRRITVDIGRPLVQPALMILQQFITENCPILTSINLILPSKRLQVPFSYMIPNSLSISEMEIHVLDSELPSEGDQRSRRGRASASPSEVPANVVQELKIQDLNQLNDVTKLPSLRSFTIDLHSLICLDHRDGGGDPQESPNLQQQSSVTRLCLQMEYAKTERLEASTTVVRIEPWQSLGARLITLRIVFPNVKELVIVDSLKNWTYTKVCVELVLKKFCGIEVLEIKNYYGDWLSQFCMQQHDYQIRENLRDLRHLKIPKIAWKHCQRKYIPKYKEDGRPRLNLRALVNSLPNLQLVEIDSEVKLSDELHNHTEVEKIKAGFPNIEVQIHG